MLRELENFIRSAVSRFLLGLTASFVFFPVLASAQTAEYPNYPVLAVDKPKGIIAIADEINIRTPLAFEKTLSEVPNASVLLLNSPGGSIHSALSIAARVRSLRMTTVVRDDSECLSACALIFFAGTERVVRGDLGVHQISSTDNKDNMVSGQFALADIIDALNDYEVPSEVIGAMLRTPPNEMYVFSRSELVKLGLYDGRQYGSTRSQNPANKSQMPAIDMSNPQTWRGMIITGALIGSGKKWYADLRLDGTTTFHFASGQRTNGQYYLTKTQVCFKLEPKQDYDCRRPVAAQDGVRWYDEDGNYQSVLLRVEEKSSVSASSPEKIAESVAKQIAPNECALIVASRPTVAEARRYVLENVPDRFVHGFRGKNGWISISLGTLMTEEADPVLSSEKANGSIPQDSYCTSGSSFADVVDLGLD
jgi:hypothetical protein